MPGDQANRGDGETAVWHGRTPRLTRREGQKLPNRIRLYMGGACQGYDKEHPNIDFPYKKPKDGELTEEED